MAKSDYRGQAAQVETVATIELPNPEEESDIGPVSKLSGPEARLAYGLHMGGGRFCTICTHPQRTEIEQLVLQQSYRKVAKQFNVGYHSIFRHVHNHFVVPV